MKPFAADSPRFDGDTRSILWNRIGQGGLPQVASLGVCVAVAVGLAVAAVVRVGIEYRWSDAAGVSDRELGVRWVRGVVRFGYRSGVAVRTDLHGLTVLWGDRARISRFSGRQTGSWAGLIRRIELPALATGVRFRPVPTRQRRFVAYEIFAGPLILIALAPVSVWAMTRRRFGSGRCAACGYDLRATPERCPECGLAVADRLPSLPLPTEHDSDTASDRRGAKGPDLTEQL